MNTDNVGPKWTEADSNELRRLRAIIDMAPVLISIKDRQSVVRLANRMFEVLDGPAADAYVDRSVFEMFPRDIAEHLWRNDLSVFQTGQVLEAEEVVRHRDGAMHTYLTYKYPLRQANGEIGEVCAISTDITALKYYEQKALEAMYRAEEANRIKSEFLAHISHEIRTPLTVIHGYAELIAKKVDAEPESIPHWIGCVIRASRQMELIIKDILDLSKVEAGAIELELATVDLHQLLLDLKHGFMLKAQEKNLNFQVLLGHDAPSTIVTDGLRFRQILDNLVSNAMKFTEQGSVEVVVQRAPAEAGRYLEIWVRDTGIGLSEEEQKKLFQPFVQADGSIPRKYGGTGLGLMLAKRLAHVLGGDVQIHCSVPGVGTDMLVTIACDAAASMAMKGNIPESSPPGTGQLGRDPGQSLKGRRLLLVEDSDDIRELLRYFLMQNGAQVETAGVGEEALLRTADQEFDLVLMDLQMPVMDGMQTMMTMRARRYQGAIVAVTAHAWPGEREKCLQAGFDEFLPKPIQLPEVLHVLQRTFAAK